MITVTTIDELTELTGRHAGLFVRWSRGPEADAAGTSSDDLSSVRLPGLSANPLAQEPWWGDRSARLWIARRLYDYSHLQHDRGPGSGPGCCRAWEVGRGPDNEPLVCCDRPIAWIAGEVMAEAERIVADQNQDWGRLRRE
jgi:Family of unknown function (DUF6098)